MNFSFNVNEIFQDEITIVDHNLVSGPQRIQNRKNFCQLQNKLSEVIDKMGEASAIAQALHGPITTSLKLKVSDQKLYIMKESTANNGQGSIVGILKVGRKKLFIYDHTKVQHETYPLCVLDFYVHESRQRKGCGRKLFDFMLKKEAILVQELAIDRPSTKFLLFLSKHYQLKNHLPQVNNFVIFEGFFDNYKDFCEREKTRNNYNKWSSLGTSFPGFGHSYPRSDSRQQEFTQNVAHKYMCPGTPGRFQSSQMLARDMMYSRHELPSDRVYQKQSNLSGDFFVQPPSSVNKNINNRSDSSSSSFSNMSATMQCCQGQSVMSPVVPPVTYNYLVSNTQTPSLAQQSQPSSSPQQDQRPFYEWKFESSSTPLSLPHQHKPNNLLQQHKNGEIVDLARTKIVSDKKAQTPFYSMPSNSGSWTVMSALRDQMRKTMFSNERR